MTDNATPAVSGTVRGVVLLPYQRLFLGLPRGTQLRLACHRKSGRAIYIEMLLTRQELLREIQQNVPVTRGSEPSRPAARSQEDRT